MGGEEANGQWRFGLFAVFLNLKYFKHLSVYYSCCPVSLSLSKLCTGDGDVLNWTAGFELI